MYMIRYESRQQNHRLLRPSALVISQYQRNPHLIVHQFRRIVLMVGSYWTPAEIQSDFI